MLFYMCRFAMGLTHCYKTSFFLHLYILTAGRQLFIRPLSQQCDLLAMATPIGLWEVFTTDLGQMQRRRHHVTTRSLPH